MTTESIIEMLSQGFAAGFIVVFAAFVLPYPIKKIFQIMKG